MQGHAESSGRLGRQTPGFALVRPLPPDAEWAWPNRGPPPLTSLSRALGAVQAVPYRHGRRGEAAHLAWAPRARWVVKFADGSTAGARGGAAAGATRWPPGAGGAPPRPQVTPGPDPALCAPGAEPARTER